jgi:hypothetical protein
MINCSIVQLLRSGFNGKALEYNRMAKWFCSRKELWEFLFTLLILEPQSLFTKIPLFNEVMIITCK